MLSRWVNLIDCAPSWVRHSARWVPCGRIPSDKGPPYFAVLCGLPTVCCHRQWLPNPQVCHHSLISLALNPPKHRSNTDLWKYLGGMSIMMVVFPSIMAAVLSSRKLLMMVKMLVISYYCVFCRSAFDISLKCTYGIFSTPRVLSNCRSLVFALFLCIQAVNFFYWIIFG